MARLKKKTHPLPDPDEGTSEEFERFRDFARQIVNVPKSEIDRRQAEYDEQPKPTGKNPFKNKIIPAQ
jgi:hypothetical protein